MTTPRSRKKNALERSPLLDALDFISAAQSDVGTLYQTHCIASNGWLKAFNGMLTIATRIPEDISACPHTFTFRDAMERAGANFAIVQLERSKLLVKGDRFRAHVPCVDDPALLPNIMPDRPITPLSIEVTRALEAVQFLILENPQRIVNAAILLRRGSAVATDGIVGLEYWHGLDLPAVLLPKAAAQAISRAGKQPVQFGFSNTSATFYFEDESWIKSQLYTEQYPDIDRIFNVKSNPWPVPEGVFEAVRALEPFTEGGTLYFDRNVLRTHLQDGTGAAYELNGIPNGVAYGVKPLLAIEAHTRQVDFAGPDNTGYFFNGNVRGVIKQKVRT